MRDVETIAVPVRPAVFLTEYGVDVSHPELDVEQPDAARSEPTWQSTDRPSDEDAWQAEVR
jgi:hypothetical protein